jgi:hypothetical protein
MSETPKADIALERAGARAMLVAKSMGYLGSEREADAERLADAVMASFEAIRAAAWTAYTPAAELPEATRQEINEQLRQHGERWAKVSYDAVVRTLHQALQVATGREP